MFSAYLITCSANGKLYVGVTKKTIARRWAQHLKTAARAPRGVLHLAIRKYGSDAFSVEHIASAKSYEELLELEQVLIAQHNTISPFGYNLTAGGEGMNSFKFSDESRAKMSEARIGIRMSEETCARMSAAAKERTKHWTAEHKKHLSEAKMGHPVSEETRNKLRSATFRLIAEGRMRQPSAEARARGAIKRKETMARKRAAGYINPAIGQKRKKRTSEQRAAQSVRITEWWARRAYDMRACAWITRRTNAAKAAQAEA